MDKKMNVNYIEFAVPFFFLFIAFEIIFSLITKKKLYRLNDAITSLSCGVTEQVIESFLKTIGLAMYLYCYENFKITEINTNSIFNWIICFFIVDLAYYIFHKSSHSINFIWATHIVHHQSEEYNLSTALRQSSFQNTISAFFFLPIAVMGFSVYMFLVCYQINLIYQFFVHTKTIKKMGFIEKFMNTPSHHRVHHAKNDIYIDKNFAGVFIIWDKMFNTFEEEIEEPTYGIVSPVKNFNPLWLNLSYWKDLIVFSIKTPKIKDKILIWFKGPGALKLESKDK
ncbi:MAG: sterol desaturase family protein, partial [Cyanobacteriota bacterium]